MENLSKLFDAKNLEFKSFVNAFINYPKILIALVNGPAIGIGATMICLCDIVYATENATFSTPFVKLGLCCEGCSSYLYPKIMGKSKASELLLLSEKITAKEAYDFGLISKVIPQNETAAFLDEIKKYGRLSVESVKINKGLMARSLRKVLSETNDAECQTLRKCQESEQFFSSVLAFMERRKSKL